MENTLYLNKDLTVDQLTFRKSKFVCLITITIVKRSRDVKFVPKYYLKTSQSERCFFYGKYIIPK
jgi:hypothetical protein